MKTDARSYIQTQVKSNLQLRDLYKEIKRDLAEVEVSLQNFTKSSNSIISEIGSYLFNKTGKRIRPAVLLLISKIFGYKGRDNITLSALVETIHTASLLHDDIIDQSHLRRGRQTVHSKWGPNITVLLGDYLYITTLGQSLRTGYPEVTQILLDTSAQMIEGELDEYALSGDLKIRESDYLSIINKKTASLFSASCEIGGILAGISADLRDQVAAAGMKIGMCFQIIDDLLDYTGEEKTMGKPVLSDLAEGRITLPLIYTLKNDDGQYRARIAELMNANKSDRDFREIILDIVQSNGALDYSRKVAEVFALETKALIAQWPPSDYRDAFDKIPDFILTRNT